MRLSALVWEYNLHTPGWGLCLAGGIRFLSETEEAGGELLPTGRGGAG